MSAEPIDYSIFVAQRDLRIRRSGTTGNNLGGVMYTDEIPETALQNTFKNVTETEAKNGVRDYIGLYLLNTNPKVTAKGLVMFSPGTSNSSTDIRFGVDPQGVGDGTTFGVGQTIPNKTTRPEGVAWKNGTVRSSESSLIIPDLPPNRTILTWYERGVTFNTQSSEDDRMPVIVDTNNITGDTGIAEEEETSTDVVTGDTETNEDNDELNDAVNSEGNINNFFFLGNATNADDVSAWIRNLAKHYLKDMIKFCFGREDVTTITKRNQIINGLDTAAYAGYQSYNRRNINYTILDTSKYQTYTNPSTHYNKIKTFLENANRNPRVDFIVVMMGTPIYGELPDNDDTDNIKIDIDARKTYHELFVKYGVHLVICSGINNYQRHHVLGYNNVDPSSPSVYFTGQAPNYVIAEKEKNFGNTGTLIVNVGSGVKYPKHTIPQPETYTAKAYVPKGVGYLKLFTTRRTSTRPPILEGRYYDYYVPPLSPTTTRRTARIKNLVDKFSITFEQPPP